MTVALPQEFAKALKLNPGDYVQLELEDRKILITRLRIKKALESPGPEKERKDVDLVGGEV